MSYYVAAEGAGVVFVYPDSDALAVVDVAALEFYCFLVEVGLKAY